MKDDLSLLREFVRDRSDSGFEELVWRHIDLVHTAALRQLGGDADLARDATQAVFRNKSLPGPDFESACGDECFYPRLPMAIT